MLSCDLLVESANFRARLRRHSCNTSLEPCLQVRPLVEGLDGRIWVNLHPREGLDISKAVLALPSSRKVLATGKPDFKHPVESLGLVEVSCIG